MAIVDRLRSGETVTLSTIKLESKIIKLYLTLHTLEEDINWSEEPTVLTDFFEFGTSRGTIEYDLCHNINRDDGWIFRFSTWGNEQTCEVGFVSLLTDRDEEGGVVVPTSPYDEDSFQMPAGIYRLSEEVTTV